MSDENIMLLEKLFILRVIVVMDCNILPGKVMYTVINLMAQGFYFSKIFTL